MNLNMQSQVGARTLFNGREYDYFAGCGYLGLQSHPAVLQAAQKTLQKYGLSTATRAVVTENTRFMLNGKTGLRFFWRRENDLFCLRLSGYDILTQTNCRANDHIFIDSQAHYSLWDGAQATNNPSPFFPHLNPERLAEILKNDLHPEERPVVLSDGVFPVSGEIALLPDYLEVSNPMMDPVCG